MCHRSISSMVLLNRNCLCKIIQHQAASELQKLSAGLWTGLWICADGEYSDVQFWDPRVRRVVRTRTESNRELPNGQDLGRVGLFTLVKRRLRGI